MQTNYTQITHLSWIISSNIYPIKSTVYTVFGVFKIRYIVFNYFVGKIKMAEADIKLSNLNIYQYIY